MVLGLATSGRVRGGALRPRLTGRRSTPRVPLAAPPAPLPYMFALAFISARIFLNPLLAAVGAAGCVGTPVDPRALLECVEALSTRHDLGRQRA